MTEIKRAYRFALEPSPTQKAELAAETRRFFRRRQRQPHIVRDYFGGPHVRYGLDENPMSF
ncbi:hypothetical protein [Streptomyces sp. IGB124]|uniref:hypothetical protein n=1 Tax=Streptomyces sp. IGB124 TaxID=1519485 RepID=UPI0006AE37B5|nr:hypothetical protein [Streptomyces sp. IGB124]KOU62686.1 hypothetical protein ADK96_25955 [Streptomyces sp. IGB124]